jgi:hypothetical protein
VATLTIDGIGVATMRDPAGALACHREYVAFIDRSCVASGKLPAVARQVKELLDGGCDTAVIIFDAATSEPVEVDFRGTSDEVIARLETARADVEPKAGGRPATPGRPKLGVVAREVTLLPRHWEWLSEQPGGASVTLRKLVEEARRTRAGEAAVRQARESCYRFMTTMAGDEPDYEEALRALFAGDARRFDALTEQWPLDVRDHARRLASGTPDA